VQHDLAKGEILVVPVRAPATGSQIHLYISALNWTLPDLHHGPAKIRSALHAVETWVQHPDWLAIKGGKPIAQHTLMLPNRLQ
jgi:hypothetical protein